MSLPDLGSPTAADRNLEPVSQKDRPVFKPLNIFQIDNDPLGTGHESIVFAENPLYISLGCPDLFLAVAFQIKDDPVIIVFGINNIMQKTSRLVRQDNDSLPLIVLKIDDAQGLQV